MFQTIVYVRNDSRLTGYIVERITSTRSKNESSCYDCDLFLVDCHYYIAYFHSHEVWFIEFI